MHWWNGLNTWKKAAIAGISVGVVHYIVFIYLDAVLPVVRGQDVVSGKDLMLFWFDAVPYAFMLLFSPIILWCLPAFGMPVGEFTKYSDWYGDFVAHAAVLIGSLMYALISFLLIISPTAQKLIKRHWIASLLLTLTINPATMILLLVVALMTMH